MSDEQKKPESGPVVVRKGHVKPPPPGTPIEAPVTETLPGEGAAAAPAPDPRPLWQRLADEKARGGAPGAPARRGPPPGAPTGGPRGPRGPRGPGGGPRGPRPDRERRPRDRREASEAPGAERTSLLPPGEPPPA